LLGVNEEGEGFDVFAVGVLVEGGKWKDEL
jgi:hypothetical protein